MNEPTEHAQKETGHVTAGQLCSVFKRGWRCGIHGEAALHRASYSDAFVFTLSVSVDPIGKKKVPVRTEIKVPGWVTNGQLSKREERQSPSTREKYMRYTDWYRPTRGFWYLYSADRIMDVLELLPTDAEVALHVYLDAGTQEYLIRADVQMQYEKYEGLHADYLYLVATWTRRGKKVERRYLIDTTTIPHNTSRFGYERGQ